MKKIKFQNTDEFERVFKKRDLEITDVIYESIEEASNSKKKTANLFEISFEDVDLTYDITLPNSQWETALQSCLDIYTELSESDKAIDTYLLKKRVSKQVNKK